MVNNEDYRLKVENRYIVEFPESFELPSWLVNTITLPTYTLNVGWEPITIGMVDRMVKSTTKVVYDKIINPMIEGTLGSNVLSIKTLSATGEVMDNWLVAGKFTKVNFGHGDYKSDEPMKIVVIFQPDNCKLVGY